MAYTVFNGTTKYPAQTSYQAISLTANIVLSWPTSFGTNYVAAGYNAVNPTTTGLTITLPDATLGSVGSDTLFSNTGTFSYNVLDNTGGLVTTIAAGQIIDVKLTDTTTSTGIWLPIAFLGGSSGITSFMTTSSDSSIVINGGNTQTIVPPGGTINFQLPTSISNLNNVATNGISVITGTAPLTWGTATITGGTNVVIANGNGTDGNGNAANPSISLATALTGITSITSATNIVGSLTTTDVTANGVTTSTSTVPVNDNISFTTTGTGVANLNGVTIDLSGNVSNINNLTINGAFNNPYISNGWGTFTDSSGSITLEDSANITSVTKVSTGTYLVTFSTAQPNINYTVVISTGTTGGILPSVTHGRLIPTARTKSSFQICVFDASGALVIEAQQGVSFVVMVS